MSAPLTSDQVWREMEKQIFAVLASVTPRGEPRTAGVVYIVRGRRIYIITGRSSWKARNILSNPKVAMTITISKRIPFLPWIKIPAATVSFHGEASVHAPEEVPAEIRQALMRGLAAKPEVLATVCIIKVTPKGRFMMYGVGMPMLQMRKPEEARGYAPV